MRYSATPSSKDSRSPASHFVANRYQPAIVDNGWCIVSDTRFEEENISGPEEKE